MSNTSLIPPVSAQQALCPQPPHLRELRSPLSGPFAYCEIFDGYHIPPAGQGFPGTKVTFSWD